jgi:hypothetical protein
MASDAPRVDPVSKLCCNRLLAGWIKTMTDAERKALLEKMQASVKEAKKMTPEQARRRLASEGFCDESGRLSRQYGGKVAARR